MGPWARDRSAGRSLPALVLVVLVALSVAAWWIVRNGIDRQDRALLKDHTSQAVLLLQTNIEHTSLGLGSVGVEHQVFEQQADAIRTSSTMTVALVTKGQVVDARGHVAPGPPQVRVAVGPALHDGEPLTGELANIALNASSTLSASRVIHLAGRPYLVFSVVPPSISLPGYVALEVNEIFPRRPSPTTGPFRQLDIALYATPTPQSAELIASTTGRTPLPGPTVLRQLRVGSLEWAVVGAAKAPLLDRWAQATPWIVLGVGLALALGLAITVDTLMRRQREQRTVAETLQAALLPETLPQLGSTETAVRYLPGVEGLHVGGDWYDLIALDDSHLLAVVGDVSGHGLPAAAVMATLLYSTRAYAAEGHAPEVILGKLSGLLSVERSDVLATVLLIMIDLEGQNITVVNGGHPPPLLLRDDRGEYVNGQIGLPVGVSDTVTYTPVTVPVSPGTTLLAFTDGLIERRGENLDVGLGRLRRAATADGKDSLEGLLSHLVGSQIGKGAADDTVLLGVRWRAVHEPQSAPLEHEAGGMRRDQSRENRVQPEDDQALRPRLRTQTFPGEPVSVRQARAFVVDALGAYPEDVIDSAELGVSELATNALRHPGGFTVKVTTTEAHVRIEVTDTGEGKPEKRNPGPLDLSGRGLQIVEALSDHWEVTPARPAGKTVAFVISLAPEASDGHMSLEAIASTPRR